MTRRDFARATEQWVRDRLKRHLLDDATKSSKSRIKRLRGIDQPQYRRRVDELRVFYDVTDATVELLAIVPKREAAAWLAQLGRRREAKDKP